MSEIIDLEAFPEDVDYESIYRDARERNDTDSSGDSRTGTGKQQRLITIKSYTEICIEPGDSITDEASPRTKAKCKPGNKNRETGPDKTTVEFATDSKPRDSTPKIKLPKRKEQINVWRTQKRAATEKKEKKSCWSTVFNLCCGVSKEHQWYSLMGKGVFLVFFMLILYIVVSLAVLPFLIVAAAVGSVFFYTGIVSYLAFASKKVGLSIDDDGDAKYLGKVWGSWV